MPSNPRTITAVLPAACVPPHATAPSARMTRANRAGLLTRKRLLIKRLAVHVRRGIDPEQAQHRRRDVDERGVLAVDLPAGEQHARDEPRIDAVVTAPRLGVVLEDRPRDHTRGAVPGSAVSRVEADDEVRRVLEVRPAVKLRGVEGLVDRGLAGSGVAQPLEGRHDLRLDPGRILAGLDDALPLAPLDVQ